MKVRRKRKIFKENVELLHHFKNIKVERIDINTYTFLRFKGDYIRRHLFCWTHKEKVDQYSMRDGHWEIGW